jgi:pSer/pThr/pTyr-binding forkhead associated (FHA) protein
VPGRVATLIRVSGSAGPEKFPLDDPEIEIGRAPESALLLDDLQVSRRHALIRTGAAVGHRYVLEDVGSRNGTYVNGRRLTEPHTLEQGDEVQIGPISFTFVDPNATMAGVGRARLSVDEEARVARVAGRPVRLGAKEYKLLALLMRHVGQPLSQQEIGREVWPEYDGAATPANVDSLVRRLREKLAAGGATSVAITSQRGRGYMLTVD